MVAEPRQRGVRYDLGPLGRTAGSIRTNADGAVDFKLMTSAAAVPAASTWRDLVAHKPGRLIAGFAAYKDHLVRLERENALDRLVVRDRAGAEHAIAFDEAAYALNLDRRLRVRHHGHPLRLPVADHAAAVVRLRHGHAARAPCARPRRCRPATIRRAYETRRLLCHGAGRRARFRSPC